MFKRGDFRFGIRIFRRAATTPAPLAREGVCFLDFPVEAPLLGLPFKVTAFFALVGVFFVTTSGFFCCDVTSAAGTRGDRRVGMAEKLKLTLDVDWTVGTNGFVTAEVVVATGAGDLRADCCVLLLFVFGFAFACAIFDLL